MKALSTLAVITLLSFSAWADNPGLHVSAAEVKPKKHARPADLVIHAKLVEMTATNREVKLPRNLAALENLKGVDIVPVPDLKIHSGAFSQISVMRDFCTRTGLVYPGQFGVVLHLRAALKEGGVAYAGDWDLTSPGGTDRKTGEPVFKVAKPPGLQGTAPLDKQVVLELDASTDFETDGRVIYAYHHKTFAILSFSKE